MKGWATLLGMLCMLSLTTLQAAQPCTACHPDLSAQLGAKHPKVKAEGIAKCLPCHDSAKKTAEAGKNAFSARLHAAHAKPDSGVTCEVCHTRDAKGFAVRGARKPLGKASAEDVKLLKETFASVAGGQFLASSHAKAGLACSGCHASRVPTKGDSVEDERCLACHGPLDTLIEKTRPKDAHLPNPHKSHYGAMACTACHFGHQPSVVMCKDCHPKFKLTISHGK